MDFFLTLILFIPYIMARYKIIALPKGKLAKRGIRLVNQGANGI